MTMKENEQVAYKLICPVPRCCDEHKRHARRDYVEKCIKNFNRRLNRDVRSGKMSEAERHAYNARVDTFKEKLKRGRKRNQMQFVAAETVDWWKAAEGTPLQDVPFGSFEPEREKRRRVSNNVSNTDATTRSSGDDHGYDSWGDDHNDQHDHHPNCPTPDALHEAAAPAGPGVDSLNGRARRRHLSETGMMDQMFNQVTNGTSSFNEAVKPISSSLHRFATHERFSTLKHGIEFTLQQIDGAVEILEKKVSLTPVTDFLKRTMASAPGQDDGLNLESLIKRIRAPYRTLYSCKFGHDVDEHANTRCEYRHVVRGTETVCGEPRVIASYHLSLDQWLKHFMRDPKFAMHIRDGPEELSREQSDPDVLSLWKGAAMTRLAEWVDLSLRNHIPVVIQMFIDGFEPTESTRSVWAVVVRVLNLPGDIANDYLFPLCLVDGKSIDGSTKPDSIDASLRVSVEELQSFYSIRPGPEKYLEPWGAITTYDVSKGAQVKLRVFLHSVSCDMKAMQYVAKHAMVPGKWVCHLCTIEGAVFKTPGTSGQGRHSTVYTTIDNQTGTFQWRLKNDEEARYDCKRADFYAQDERHKFLLKGHLGTPVFADLPYFDIVDCFLVCAMHQIHNVVVRCLSKSLGLSGWTGDIIHKFINSDETQGWGGSGREWMRSSNLPWEGLPGPVEGEWTEDDLQKLKLPALRDLLTRSQLPKTGNKPELVARLMEYQSSRSAVARDVDAPECAVDEREEYTAAQRQYDCSDEDAGDDDDEDDEDDDDGGGDAGESGKAPDDQSDADLVNEDGLTTLFPSRGDGIVRSVFSKSWWNGFGSILPWPHKARKQHSTERSLRMAYVFARSVVPCSSVHGNVVDVLHPKTSKKAGVKTWFRKVKMTENKDHAITMLLPVMMCLGGVHFTVVKAWADLFWGLRILCSYAPRRSQVEDVQRQWPSIYRELERTLFPTDRAAALHALYHLPAQVLHQADLWRTSSYAMESYLGPCKALCKLNRRRPVQTLMKRLAAIMSLKDLRSLLGFQVRLHSGQTKGHLVYDNQGEVQGCTGESINVLSIVPGQKHRGVTGTDGEPLIIHLIYAFYESIPPPGVGVWECVNRYEFELEQFKALDLPYRVCIQGERSKRTATNNSLVLLAPGTEPEAESALNSANEGGAPDLGDVVRIFRIRVGSRDQPLETRTLLLVRRYQLCHVDKELERCGLKGRVWRHYKPATPRVELVDIRSVIDQAFVGDDPRRPSHDGGYYAQFVFTKGKTAGERLVA